MRDMLQPTNSRGVYSHNAEVTEPTKKEAEKALQVWILDARNNTIKIVSTQQKVQSRRKGQRSSQKMAMDGAVRRAAAAARHASAVEVTEASAVEVTKASAVEVTEASAVERSTDHSTGTSETTL